MHQIWNQYIKEKNFIVILKFKHQSSEFYNKIKMKFSLDKIW